MKKTLSINGNPVDFSYTNEITAIEHTFIKNFFKKNDYDGLIDYLEDCVLWKRQFYFDPKQKSKKGFGGN